MSLKALEMDSFLLAGLYSQPLVLPPDSRQEGKTDTQAVPFLGKNARRILLVVQNPEQAFVGEQVFSMLSRLLNACGLTMEDVALVNVARWEGLQAGALFKSFNPHKVIVFGTLLPGLSGARPKNQPWSEGGAELLYTDTLEAMDADKALKMPFWTALKSFFNLKA